ncbi:MAG TPA: hypothetical protein VEK08_18945 [Planctomycetota bacterium]|nr:hypothetical protein [Planctomycetota bacterium]
MGMEETYISVERAARILCCGERTVQRMIASGWLKGQPGKPNKAWCASVSVKSLYQLLIVDRLNMLPQRLWRSLHYHEKILERKSRQIESAKHLSINEEQRKSLNPSPYPLPLGERENNDSERTRCLHHDFAELHQFSFGWKARQLAPGDGALQDDLIQEMSLAVLEYDQPASFEFLFELATNRAKMYIRYEVARGMLPLSAARYMSSSLAERMESVQAFIDQLIERGVPVEWIEEVLGRELDAA